MPSLKDYTLFTALTEAVLGGSQLPKDFWCYASSGLLGAAVIVVHRIPTNTVLKVLKLLK